MLRGNVKFNKSNAMLTIRTHNILVHTYYYYINIRLLLLLSYAH